MKLSIVKKEKDGLYLNENKYKIFVDGVDVGEMETKRYDGVYAHGYNSDGANYFSISSDSISKAKKAILREFDGKDLKGKKSAKAEYLPSSDSEFYPTTGKLCGQMIGCVKWSEVHTMLEPSAGKGDIVDAVKNYFHQIDRWSRCRVDIDCVEVDENLRYILKGKEYRVVHDDFLDYETKKKYDLIMMNPPFSVGARHLLKAISMVEEGGQVVCILNAETLRNAYTNERKILAKKLEQYSAKVRYIQNAFKHSERQTNVEVAIVYIYIPRQEKESEIFGRMKKAQQEWYAEEEKNEIAPKGDIEYLIRAYELESSAGVEFLKEYGRLVKHTRIVDDDTSCSMIRVEIGKEMVVCCDSGAINAYLRNVRYKYWNKLFNDEKFKNKMTTTIRNDYNKKIEEMEDYEFSEYNIQQVVLDIQEQLLNGADDEMEKLFDKLSCEHSYWHDCQNNIHYYNGWKTNKAHKVNYKVIIPCNGYSSTWKYNKGRYQDALEDHITSYKCYDTLRDIEMALSYLERNGASAHGTNGLRVRLDRAEKDYQTKGIDCRYFDLTFYKKGTCHITFNEEAKILVDRLNNYVGGKRGWLPPNYGKTSYNNMTKEEQEVVLSYDGSEEDYQKVYENRSNYIIERNEILKLI